MGNERTSVALSLSLYSRLSSLIPSLSVKVTETSAVGVVKDGIGAYCHSENGEVLSVSSDFIRVQGTGNQKFSIFQYGEVKNVEIDFSSVSVVEISV